METNQIVAIINEFNGKKCNLRLSNGDLVTGIVGEIIQNTLSFEREVALAIEKNSIVLIVLTSIVALCIA
jgi:hypothetical protein